MDEELWLAKGVAPYVKLFSIKISIFSPYDTLHYHKHAVYTNGIAVCLILRRVRARVFQPFAQPRFARRLDVLALRAIPILEHPCPPTKLRVRWLLCTQIFRPAIGIALQTAALSGREPAHDVIDVFGLGDRVRALRRERLRLFFLDRDAEQRVLALIESGGVERLRGLLSAQRILTFFQHEVIAGERFLIPKERFL